MCVRVLIAEDTSINRIMLEKMIQRMDATCDSVENGADAMQKFEQFKYDIVMLDINMPGYTGNECAENIIKKCLDSQAPIPVLISMSADDDYYDPSLFYITLTKPFEMKTIDNIITRVRDCKHQAESYNIENAGKEIGLDKETMIMLAEEFIKAVDMELVSLNKFVKERNEEMIIHFAHKIKGAAANMRTEYLRQQCEDLQKADKNDFGMVAKLTAKINCSYAAYRTILVS